MIRPVQVFKEGNLETRSLLPDYQGVFLGWGVSSGVAVAIIEREDRTVALVPVRLFKFEEE